VVVPLAPTCTGTTTLALVFGAATPAPSRPAESSWVAAIAGVLWVYSGGATKEVPFLHRLLVFLRLARPIPTFQIQEFRFVVMERCPPSILALCGHAAVVAHQCEVVLRLSAKSLHALVDELIFTPACPWQLEAVLHPFAQFLHGRRIEHF